MISLTPHRDAVQKGLDEAQRQLEALEVSPAGEFERRMSLAVMASTMLNAADMVDAGHGGEAVQAAVVSAFSNVLMSHALNFTGGDARSAIAVAADTAHQILRMVVKRLEKPEADISVTVRTAAAQRGHA